MLQLPFSIVLPSPLNLQMKSLSWAAMKLQLLFFLNKENKIITLMYCTNCSVGLQPDIIGLGINPDSQSNTT